MSLLPQPPRPSQEPTNAPSGAEPTHYSSQDLELLSAVARQHVEELEHLLARLRPNYHTYLATQEELAIWQAIAAKLEAK